MNFMVDTSFVIATSQNRDATRLRSPAGRITVEPAPRAKRGGTREQGYGRIRQFPLSPIRSGPATAPVDARQATQSEQHQEKKGSDPYF
jgi:hypothetical protein